MKLFLRQFVLAIVFCFIGAAISTGICALSSAMLKNVLGFMPLWSFAVGVFISIWVCVFLRGLLAQKNYFEPGDVAARKKLNYWGRRLSQKKYMTRAKAYCTLLPYLLTGAAVIVAIIVCYGALERGGQEHCIGYSALCALLSSVAATLIIYSVESMRAFKICPQCGCVNAFIYDESLGYVSTTAYWHDSHSGVLPSSRGMTVYRRKVEECGDILSCHCAKCGKPVTVTQIYNADWHWL